MEANCFRVVVSVLTVGIFQCISVFCSLGILVLVVELLFLLHVPRIMMWGK